ncbi:MAG: sortase [Acidimicrobiaceae bacterium]
MRTLIERDVAGQRLRLRALRLAALCLLLANLVVVGLRLPSSAVEHRDSPQLVRAAIPPTTAPVTVPSTTTTTVTLPTPIDTPENGAPPPAEPVVAIGRLEIPALGVDETMYEGITLANIDHGPSHWPGTAMPGHVGNVVVAGHRITHSHPFRHLDELKTGDLAILHTAEGAFTYTFVGIDVVTPDRVDIADQTRAYTATFFACHPPGSARYRIVAHWQLVGLPAFGQPNPAALR